MRKVGGQVGRRERRKLPPTGNVDRSIHIREVKRNPESPEWRHFWNKRSVRSEI